MDITFLNYIKVGLVGAVFMLLYIIIKYCFLRKNKTELEEIENIQCPTCGHYCLGKGGKGCIDKKNQCVRL